MIGAQPELDPRVANARQNNLREKILQQLRMQQMQQRKGSALSRFAGQGSIRGSVRAISAAGPRQRAFIAGAPSRLLGGGFARLQPRTGVPGREVGVGGGPPINVGPPAAMPGDLMPPGAMGPPMGVPGPPAQHPYLNQNMLDQIFGSGLGSMGTQTAQLPPQSLVQSGPSQPLALGALGGLIPLGGGTWYDPVTQQLMGAGGGGLGMA